MSSRRSRSGGTADAERRSAGRRGPRGTRPRRTARSRSRLVAAITRTSTVAAARAADAARPRRPPARAAAWPACERHVADLVEEERAAVAPASNRPLLRLGRAGERALLVAEQLALEQVLGDGGAVDRDERAGRARGLGVMDGARHQLLARAALAGDEHAALARRDARDEPAHALDGGAGADDLSIGFERGAQAGRLPLEPGRAAAGCRVPRAPSRWRAASPGNRRRRPGWRGRRSRSCRGRTS